MATMEYMPNKEIADAIGQLPSKRPFVVGEIMGQVESIIRSCKQGPYLDIDAIRVVTPLIPSWARRIPRHYIAHLERDGEQSIQHLLLPWELNATLHRSNIHTTSELQQLLHREGFWADNHIQRLMLRRFIQLVRENLIPPLGLTVPAFLEMRLKSFEETIAEFNAKT